MPRTLPWLSGGASKKETKPKSTAPKKRSSSPDRLVTSDLEDIAPAPRNAAKKRRQREPSSSPPPASAPEVTYMDDGLGADDIYVMVEDEFYSTAQLFTAPLHRAAYERLKRLHRSRGAETLANIERATDGRTHVGTALRMKMEAKERAKKSTGSTTPQQEDTDDEDEYMAVPELAGLMSSSQISERKKQGIEEVVKAKSNTRAAAGFLQSPNKGKKTKDVFANSQRMSPVDEDESTDDDLDAGVKRTAASYAYKHVEPSLDKPRHSIERPQEMKSGGQGIFKQFVPQERKREQSSISVASSSERDRSVKKRETSFAPATNGEPTRNTGGKGSRMAEMLAKRRQAMQSSNFEPEPQRLPPYKPPAKERPIKPEHESPLQSNGIHETSSGDNMDKVRSPGSVDRRKATSIKKEPEEEQRKKTRRDDIPTFLF